MTYRDRVPALASIPDQEAVTSLIPDIETWAALLKKARNGAAHSGKAPANAEEEPAIQPEDASTALARRALRSVLRFCIKGGKEARATPDRRIPRAFQVTSGPALRRL